MKRSFFYLYVACNLFLGIANATEQEDIVNIEKLSFYDLIKLLKQAADNGDEELQMKISSLIMKSDERRF